jgi:hypothetical protein
MIHRIRTDQTGGKESEQENEPCYEKLKGGQKGN